jgi:hypothetical protein
VFVFGLLLGLAGGLWIGLSLGAWYGMMRLARSEMAGRMSRIHRRG